MGKFDFNFVNYTNDGNILILYAIQQKLTRKYKQLNMQQMSLSEMPSPQKKNKKSYYYPSERQQSCCGKGSFKPRFPLLEEMQKTSNCAKFCAFFCFFLTHQRKNIPRDTEELERLLPIRTPIFTSQENTITYTWIGHSTAVIAIGTQANIIIDPVFSHRASPFQCIGPQRYRVPACQIGSLPTIHAVFVSHDHYDHLDEHSLNSLHQTFAPTFFAGLDSKDVFPKNCKIEELDWTETKKVLINGYEFGITFVPVCHWSKRGLFQRNTRLWGGFVIKTPKGQKIFYSGDTAYCEIFEEIGQLFGPFDLAILPIGAYEPRHLLRFAHTDPEEAVVIHKEIKSKKSVGVHWGTFPLGFEHYHQPKEDLQKAVKKHGLKEDEFITLQHGEEIKIDYL